MLHRFVTCSRIADRFRDCENRARDNTRALATRTICRKYLGDISEKMDGEIDGSVGFIIIPVNLCSKFLLARRAKRRRAALGISITDCRDHK